jgi:hypothetical protein
MISPKMLVGNLHNQVIRLMGAYPGVAKATLPNFSIFGTRVKT